MCLMSGVVANSSPHLLPSYFVGAVEHLVVEDAFTDLLFDASIIKSIQDMKRQVEVMLAPMPYEIALVGEVRAAKVASRRLRNEGHPRPHMT